MWLGTCRQIPHSHIVKGIPFMSTYICYKVLYTVKSYCLHHIFQQFQQNCLSLTLQSCGRSEGLVYVGGKEGLKTRTCTHVHTGTDVEVGVYKEREATEKTSTGTGRTRERGREGGREGGRKGLGETMGEKGRGMEESGGREKSGREKEKGKKEEGRMERQEEGKGRETVTLCSTLGQHGSSSCRSVYHIM